jgi:hypothetical protein
MLTRLLRGCRSGAKLLLAVALLGCEPEIGDECSNTVECNGSDSDRICLAESANGFPGGYCTEFNCGPSDCPEEALCVAYRSELAEGCAGSGQAQRLQRSYCMRRCDTGSDCRSGYACVSVAEGNPWGAEVLASNPGSQKICALAYSAPADAGVTENAVCRAEPPASNTTPAASGSNASDAGQGGDASQPPDASTERDASETGAVSSMDATSSDAALALDASLVADAAIDGSVSSGDVGP